MIGITTTTIQTSEEVQHQLFQLIHKIEKELGYRVSYSDAIQFLLDSQEPKLDKRQFIKNLEQYRGTLKPGEGKKYLKELRQLEPERDKRINRD